MNTRDTPVFSEISIFSLIHRDIIKSVESHGKSSSRVILMDPALASMMHCSEMHSFESFRNARNKARNRERG